MTDHPITPSRELVLQWIKECDRPFDTSWPEYEQEIANRAAQWVYDQRSKVNEAELQQARDEELEECCEEIKSLPSPLGIPFGEMASNALRAARRPKPPSLKKLALEEVGAFEGMGTCNIDIIRRALEMLPND